MSRRAKKKQKKSFRGFLMLLMILIISFGIYFGYQVYKNGGGLQGFLVTILGKGEEQLKDLDTIYVLVLRHK